MTTGRRYLRRPHVGPTGELLVPETILVPFEEDQRQACADYALDRAERTGGTVHAVGVVDTARYGEPALSAAEVFVDEAEDAVKAAIAEFAGRARTRGVVVERRCLHGHLPEELLAYARDVDADVLVCDRRLPHAVRTRMDDVVDAVVTRPERARVT